MNLRLLRRKKKHASPKPGSSPGQIIVSPESARPVISRISYSPSECFEVCITDVDEVQTLPKDRIHWINFDGLGDADALKRIGDYYQIHPLALEDIVSGQAQRPKIEEYENALFIVARMPVFKNGKCIEYETEKLSHNIQLK